MSNSNNISGSSRRNPAFKCVLLAWAFLGLTSLLLYPSVSHSADYYAGKTITIVVGYKPGGGYDRYARLMGKYMPKYIPGNPTVIIQNMPGANSMIAANHLYSVVKPDGLTIGTFNRNLPIAQLIKVEGVQFDLRKFAWLGSPASETTVLAVRSDLPYKTFDEFRKSDKEIVVGTTGPGANTHDFPLLLEQFTGAKFKIVSGYSSSSDIMLAIERKEVDARAGSYSSIVSFIERGLVKPLVRSRAVDPAIAHLPVDEDLASNAKGKAIMAIRSAPETIGRPYVAPPGTSPEVMKILKDAFQKALQDKEFLEEATKSKLSLQYVSAEEAHKVIDVVLNQPPEITQDLAKYIKFGE